MSLEKYFCSSPWLHMRINSAGEYEVCRWADSKYINHEFNLAAKSPIEFFQKDMAVFRSGLLAGNSNPLCNHCHQMDRHRKPSGRLKQLLKVGVNQDNFDKTLKSSTYLDKFRSSSETQGLTDLHPIDWQIDLGNYCNSACVFCDPISSSKLATEFKKLKIIDSVPKKSWTQDPALVDKFIQSVCALNNIQYMHFIGGETLITPAFKHIIKALISNGVSKSISLGFTTNLTVWDDELIELFKQFSQIHVGLSIESMDPINDYVRYPSQIDQVKTILSRWLTVSEENNWLVQLRITPTCLTINSLATVYSYAYEHNIGVESCNFINKPEFMRPSVLPRNVRNDIIQRLKYWISQHQIIMNNQLIVNTRDPNIAKQNTIQDAESYVNYLQNEPDESHRAPALVEYLKRLESLRGNSILDYLPQYEEFFRTSGY
jgi:sulfatase maturation enzyme AslB (radical SAM superfamily)